MPPLPSPQELLSKVTGTSKTSYAPPISISALAKSRAQSVQDATPTFLKNLFSTGRSALLTGAKVADTFVSAQRKNVSDFAHGTLNVKPEDWVEGLKKTGIGTLKITGALAQGFNQGIIRMGTSLSDFALPGYKNRRLVTPPSALLESITGAPKTDLLYQDVAEGTEKWALDKGATPGGAKVFAGFAVLGTLFMDEPGIGPGVKAAFTIGKDALETLAKTTDDAVIKATIKKENPSMSDKAVEFVTPLFKNATSPKEVSAVVRFVQGGQRTAAKNIEKHAVLEKAKQEVPTPPRPRPLLKDVQETGGTFLNKKTVDAMTTAYKESNPTILERPIAVKKTEEGGYVAIEGQHRLAAARAAGVEPPIVVLTEKQVDGLSAPEVDALAKETYAKQKTLEPSPQKTIESGQTTPESGTENYRTAPVDLNLVKELGLAKDPYEVMNTLKNEFPNLPDRVIDRMTQRFVRTKRVQNVENLLRAARNLDDRFKGGEVKTGTSMEPTFGRKLTDKEQSVATVKRVAEEKLPKSAGEVLDKTINPTVRKLMRQDQKVAYIKAIKDKFEDPHEAVAASHEYDRIWDDLNQKVVDQYDTLSMQKSFMEDTLAEDPASALYDTFYKRTKKDPSDPTESLINIMHRAQAKKKDLDMWRSGRGKMKKPPELTKYEERAVRLDTTIEEYGFNDFDVVQTAVERHATMRAEAERMGAELKTLKPRVKEARILQEGLDDIAIVPRAGVATIDRLTTAANVRDYYDDISGFAGQARDLYRNFEHFFGEKYDEIKKAVLDPFDEAKGRFVDVNKDLGDGLAENVVEKYGIRRGSKESAAIQRYGDTGLSEGERMSGDDLIKAFGKEKAGQIIEADTWFRSQYDRLIEDLNVVRKKIYPNSPGKLIAKRKDYYRHFQDIGETWGDALREFFETPSGIDPNLVGLSEYTKAKTKFLPFAEQRLGKESVVDAVGGFIDYVPAFAYAKEIDPQISAFRYLRRKLAEAAPKTGQEMKLPNGTTAKSKGAEAFLGFLDDFSRDLTGNTNPMDRYIQRIIGRKNIRVGRFINNRMKSNTIGGNLGSALAQVANVPAGIADTKLYAVKGLQRSLGGTIAHNEPMASSIFLRERYAQSLKERFPLQFSDRPAKASADFLRKQAGWILRKADEVGTRFIWNSQYEKALGTNVADPVKYADDATRKIVAGRGIGEVPLGQKALVTQFIAPFTLEVGNAWWIMKGWVGKKDFSAVATFFVANYVLNEISENIRGSRITFDPINATIDGAAALSQEWQNGNYGRGIVKLLGREAGEILANIPYGQTLAAVTPDSGVQAATQYLTGAPMDKQEIFGTSNVSGRFGTPLIISGLQDAVYRLLPPVGGLQLKKTYDGLMALSRGSAKDAKGNQTFDVPASPENIARALAFGANATSESRKYFDARTDLFSRIDRQTADTFVRNAAAESDWAHMKDLVAEGKSKDAAAYLTEIAKKDPLEAKAVVAASAADKAGLSGNDRLIKMLNVANGERAKYIVEQIKNMRTKEKAAYIADLAKKKLVTNEVAKQITALISAP